MQLRQFIKLTPFILIAVGTIGLLLNEFAFDWGRNATLTFAALNLVGLIILAFGHRRAK